MSAPDSESSIETPTASPRAPGVPLHALREEEREPAEADRALEADRAPADGWPVEAGSRRAVRRPVATSRRPTGRERHDEKITIYVSSEELFDLEQARLVLRGEYGLAVDRGRIVREAVAVVLADLEDNGKSSVLVRRLRPH